MEHNIRPRSYVKLHPCTDQWMQGIQHAVVTKIDGTWVHMRSPMHRNHRFKMVVAHLGVNIILEHREWPDSHAG